MSGRGSSFVFLQIIVEDLPGKKQANKITLSFQGTRAMGGSGKEGTLCFGNSETEVFWGSTVSSWRGFYRDKELLLLLYNPGDLGSLESCAIWGAKAHEAILSHHLLVEWRQRHLILAPALQSLQSHRTMDTHTAGASHGKSTS